MNQAVQSVSVILTPSIGIRFTRKKQFDRALAWLHALPSAEEELHAPRTVDHFDRTMVLQEATYRSLEIANLQRSRRDKIQYKIFILPAQKKKTKHTEKKGNNKRNGKASPTAHRQPDIMRHYSQGDMTIIEGCRFQN